MSDHTYIIGEIGQNHNGSPDLARLLIDLISRPVEESGFGLDLKGMDAVKVTKRDLDEELSASEMNRPYDSPHSFGRTYGEHRRFLELTDEQHLEIYKHAKSKGLEFVITFCATGCLSLLRLLTPDRLKVASRDLSNLPLLAALAETGIPMILSTGMSGKEELDQALEVITRFHERIAILHCVSEYPTQPKNVNLRTIPFLRKHYPQYTIGYSDHTLGIAMPVAAVAVGADIIEKHITLDRRMKGTDHQGSLGPDGVNRMIRDIRLLNLAMGEEAMFISDGSEMAKKKLERSIATNRDLPAGHVITEGDLHLLSPGDGFQWAERSSVLGRALSRPIRKDEIIYENFLG